MQANRVKLKISFFSIPLFNAVPDEYNCFIFKKERYLVLQVALSEIRSVNTKKMSHY